MIIIKSKREIDLMREPCKVTAEIFRELEEFIKPGISTKDIDQFVEERYIRHKMTPTFKGYGGFPAAACVSVNEEIIHGIPSDKRILKEGDIVSVVTRQSFFEGIKYAMEGYRIHDIGHGVQEYAEKNGMGVIRDFTGHGTGSTLHEDPLIPNYGKPGTGAKIKKNMTLAVEPMLALGTYECRTLANDWTVVTLDGRNAAHYENTILITDGEPEILTL